MQRISWKHVDEIIWVNFHVQKLPLGGKRKFNREWNGGNGSGEHFMLMLALNLGFLDSMQMPTSATARAVPKDSELPNANKVHETKDLLRVYSQKLEKM